MYRKLLRYLRPHSWRMIGTIGASMGSALLDAYSFALLIPFLNALFGEPSLLPAKSGLIGQLLQGTIGALLDPTDKMGSLQRVILVILATVALKNVLIWFGGQLGAQLQEFVTRDLRNAVYLHLQRLPIGYFTSTRAGQIYSRVLGDTEGTKTLITNLVTSTLQNVFVIISYLILLFSISWKLTLLALVVAPALMGALQPLLKKLRRGYRRLRHDYGEMSSVLTEVIGGMRLVKSFGAEP